MKIIVNKSKLDGFIIDNEGKLRKPKYFEETGLRTLSKTIFETVADYCIRTAQTKISGDDFHTILDLQKIDFDRDTIAAIVSLQQHDYLKIENL